MKAPFLCTAPNCGVKSGERAAERSRSTPLHGVPGTVRAGIHGRKGCRETFAMSMHHVDEGQPLSFSQAGPMQLVGVPDVGAPRSNPLQMIWRRRMVLAAVTVFCVVAAGVKFLLADRVYRSEARLFVQTTGSKDPGGGGAG